MNSAENASKSAETSSTSKVNDMEGLENLGMPMPRDLQQAWAELCIAQFKLEVIVYIGGKVEIYLRYALNMP